MASGKTHDWITVAFLPSVWLVCRWGLHWGLWTSTLVTIGTFIGGFWLSPDLDTRSRPFYRWGVLRFIWWPYHWMVKHRSPLSHGIWLASWLRLIYLSAILVLFYTALSLALSHFSGSANHSSRSDILIFLHAHLKDILWLGIGIWAGSLLHIALDRLSSTCRFPARTKQKRR